MLTCSFACSWWYAAGCPLARMLDYVHLPPRRVDALLHSVQICIGTPRYITKCSLAPAPTPSHTLSQLSAPTQRTQRTQRTHRTQRTQRTQHTPSSAPRAPRAPSAPSATRASGAPSATSTWSHAFPLHCTFSTSQLPKLFQTLCVLCASHHNGVHFFHISTSKSGPREVFLAFSLANVFRATTACNFWTSQLPKVVWTWGVFSFFTCKCDSRHNGVQFFISHLARWLRTRRFCKPTFRPSGATNHWKKHSVSRLSYLFAHLHLRSYESFSSLIFSFLLFLSLWLFPSLLFICPYCRKFDF